MPSREQFARAIGSIAAGFAIAWEHLHDPVEPEAPEAIETGLTWCPICAGRVTDAPHVHGEDVIWPTEESGVMFLTDLTCADPFVLPEPETGV